MRSRPAPEPVEDDLFRQELVNIINMRHELVRLAAPIDWSVFDRQFGAQFESTTGRPALPTRLVAALLYLKHTYALSDEAVVERWVENPYFQHFCGERYFQHEMPCDPSSLVRWRKRIGEAGAEWLLTQTIEAAKASGTIRQTSLSTIVVDTTVQPKAIAYPTDSRLLNRTRQQLVDAAQAHGIELRQSYVSTWNRLRWCAISCVRRGTVILAVFRRLRRFSSTSTHTSTQSSGPVVIRLGFVHMPLGDHWKAGKRRRGRFSPQTNFISTHHGLPIRSMPNVSFCADKYRKCTLPRADKPTPYDVVPLHGGQG
jgi:hypothetical protein